MIFTDGVIGGSNGLSTSAPKSATSATCVLLASKTHGGRPHVIEPERADEVKHDGPGGHMIRHCKRAEEARALWSRLLTLCDLQLVLHSIKRRSSTASRRQRAYGDPRELRCNTCG